MKKFFLFCFFLTSTVSYAQKDTWINASLNNSVLTYGWNFFDYTALSRDYGISIEQMVNKKISVGVGLNILQYNIADFNSYFNFTRIPMFIKFHSNIVNIAPIFTIDYFHSKDIENATGQYPEFYHLINCGIGLSFSKDFNISKNFALEPSLKFTQTNATDFSNEIALGLSVKYKIN